MAAAMVKALDAPAGVKVRVLFDAFYLCPTVTKACESKGFTFFSVAQRNRNFKTANGKTRKIARLMPGLIRHRGKDVRCLLYTSPSPRDRQKSRMPSSA